MSQGETSPYLPLGTDHFRLPVRIAHASYVPGYYNKTKTQMAEHYNLSIQRQLDKSTVLTVATLEPRAPH